MKKLRTVKMSSETLANISPPVHRKGGFIPEKSKCCGAPITHEIEPKCSNCKKPIRETVFR
ncbi:hypothetical protein D4R51_04080 [bacterium]|nr:MAG: hypothetical protein D4R51_04080 [bacterium]